MESSQVIPDPQTTATSSNTQVYFIGALDPKYKPILCPESKIPFLSPGIITIEEFVTRLENGTYVTPFNPLANVTVLFKHEVVVLDSKTPTDGNDYYYASFKDFLNIDGFMNSFINSFL